MSNVSSSNPLEPEHKRYGKLVVIGYGEKRGQHHYWKCQCDCGNTTLVYSGNLERRVTRSCGCLRRENNEKLKRRFFIRRE